MKVLQQKRRSIAAQNSREARKARTRGPRIGGILAMSD